MKKIKYIYSHINIKSQVVVVLMDTIKIKWVYTHSCTETFKERIPIVPELFLIKFYYVEISI